VTAFYGQKLQGTSCARTLYNKNKHYIHVTVHRNKLLLNTQPDAVIIQIYSVIKLYMFRASSLPIIRGFLLVSFMQVSDDRIQAESG
jgi:hypothetical protein